MVSGYIEEAIAQAERMLCPKGLPHTGENNRAEHGHTECWVIGELLNEIERLQAERDRWRQAAERFAESDPRFDAFAFYFKAVRDQ